jgi:histidinol-phosphate aminotransferase
VTVGNGSCDVLRTAGEVLLSGEGEAIISRPTFPMYEIITKTHGGECVFVEGPAHRCDLQAMAARISDRTRMVFVANPDNPSGTIATQQEVDQFLACVPPSVVVVFDEAYHEYVQAEDYPDTLKYVADGRNVIVVRTFSKIYGLAGLRVGYGLAGEGLTARLRAAQLPFHTGSLALAAALAALDDVEHVRLSCEKNAEGKTYLYRTFEELGLTYVPTQSNFVLLVNMTRDAQAVGEALLRRGIIVRPADPFGMPRAIRITIGRPEQNRRVAAALKEALAELEDT